MSCRDKHVIAWESFEIGDGIFIHRWCQENMSINSIITRTHRSWIIHFVIKRRKDNVKKKIENVNEDTIGNVNEDTIGNVNEDTIGNEIVTSDQPVNAMQGTFL